jgi:hypothetical protein
MDIVMAIVIADSAVAPGGSEMKGGDDTVQYFEVAMAPGSRIGPCCMYSANCESC